MKTFEYCYYKNNACVFSHREQRESLSDAKDAAQSGNNHVGADRVEVKEIIESKTTKNV
jgi:hypothetical protein